MSKSILLTKFSQNKNINLSEKNSRIIDQASICEDIFDELFKCYISSIYITEEDSDEQYEQQIIDSENLMEVIDSIVKLYEKKCSKYFSDKMSLKEKDVFLDEMTCLLNIRKILKLKIEKYLNDTTIKLIIG